MNAVELIIKADPREATSALRQIDSAQEQTARSAQSLSTAYVAVSSALAAIGATAFVAKMTQAQVAIDRIDASLKTTFGDQAGGEFAFLEAEADRLGLALVGTAESYAKLSAAAKGTSIEGTQTREIFLGVTEAATALGISAAETDGMLNALQQMISKGNVQAEELRGQLGERLPGAFSLAAKSMGVTEQQLNKMLERGEVLATDLLPKLAVALREKYGQAAADASDNAQQALNRFDNSWQKLLRTAADSAPLVGSIDAATAALKLLDEHAGAAAFALGAMGAAAVVQNIGAITTAIRALAASTALATGGMTLLVGATALLAYEGGEKLAEAFDESTEAETGAIEMMKSHGSTASNTAAVLKASAEKAAKAAEEAADREKKALKERLAANKDAAREIVRAESERFRALIDQERSYADTVSAQIKAKRDELHAFQAEVSTLRATMAAEDAALEAQRSQGNELDAYSARLAAIDALTAKESQVDTLTDPAEKTKAYAALRTEWLALATAVEQDNATLISKEQAIYDVQAAHERLRDKVESAAVAEQNATIEQTRALEDKWDRAGERLAAYEQQVKGLEQLLDNLNGKTVEIAFKATGIEELYKVGGMASLGQSAGATAAADGFRDFGSYYTQGGKTYWPDGILADEGTSFVGSFASGTPYVPRTGLALIHQGERIIPADQNRTGAMGGSGGLSIGELNVIVPAGTPEQTARETARALIPELRRLGLRVSNG